MKNNVIEKSTIQEKILNGVKLLEEVVSSTMGPGGKLVCLNDKNVLNKKILTKDGVSVAREVRSEDPVENLAISIAQEHIEKVVSLVGDGTTTNTVLLKALQENFVLNFDDTKPFNFAVYKEKMLELLNIFNNYLDKEDLRNSISTLELIERVLKTSSNNDEEIVKNISSIFKADSNALPGINLSINEVNSKTLIEEYADGYFMQAGLIDTSFVNNLSSNSFISKESSLLILSDRLENFASLQSILNSNIRCKEDLIIVASDFSNEVIIAALTNIRQKRKNIILIRSTVFGNTHKQILSDLAIYANTKVLTYNDLLRNSLIYDNDFTLGQLSYFYADLKNSTFKVEVENSVLLSERVQQLKNLLAISTNKEDRKNLELRLRNIEAKHIFIRVGGNTEAEAKEKFDRYEDAINAVQNAINEGVVLGGGIAFSKFLADTNIFSNSKYFNLDSPEVISMSKIVKQSFLAPMERISLNMFNEFFYEKYLFYINEQQALDSIKVLKVVLENAIKGHLLLIMIKGCVLND
jgi:chaperonin GroEL